MEKCSSLLVAKTKNLMRQRQWHSDDSTKFLASPLRNFIHRFFSARTRVSLSLVRVFCELIHPKKYHPRNVRLRWKINIPSPIKLGSRHRATDLARCIVSRARRRGLFTPPTSRLLLLARSIFKHPYLPRTVEPITKFPGERGC